MAMTAMSFDLKEDNAFEQVNWKTDLMKLFQIKT